jgi:POT family proton-dependent oligopeptide transporter
MQSPVGTGENGGVRAGEQIWFGHPRGLATLFFTEMWERFSYYGMRALLILYMTAAAAGANPGLGLGTRDAAAVYGIYTALVYLSALPGGWIADRFWGARDAVFRGGCIIATGHFTMAAPLIGLPESATFYTGLTLIVLGTGLLKPNISCMVGDLYPQGGARRDAGFSIFYMGINLGGMLGPVVCALLAETYDWHSGFSAAGVGMVLGLVQYRRGGRHLGGAGLRPVARTETQGQPAPALPLVLAALIGLTLALGGAAAGGTVVTLTVVAGALGYLVVATAGLYFAWLFLMAGLSREEKKRLAVIVWLFLLAALFWSGFEQAGSSLNLFAFQLTDRAILGLTMPAGWLQSINPVFIIVLAPVFGTLWTWAATRNADPSIAVKFALGLIGLAAGFFVVAWGAMNATPENPASPAWLVATYFLHTCGELCLSPVGLSAMTKLAPRGRTGQMMGVWFIAAALGNLIAGLVAGLLEDLAPDTLFWKVAMFAGVAAIAALLASPLVRRFSGGVR